MVIVSTNAYFRNGLSTLLSETGAQGVIFDRGDDFCIVTRPEVLSALMYKENSFREFLLHDFFMINKGLPLEVIKNDVVKYYSGTRVSKTEPMKLSSREETVLSFLLEKRSYAEMSELLGLSAKIVSNLVRSILHKLYIPTLASFFNIVRRWHHLTSSGGVNYVEKQ